MTDAGPVIQGCPIEVGWSPVSSRDVSDGMPLNVSQLPSGPRIGAHHEA